MEKNKLNIDEVLALQMAGMPTREISRMDLTAFDKLYDSNPEYEGYIEKANTILDRQEELGIVSISCHDADFPKRLLAIGDDCPAIIYCLGNLELLKREKSVAVIGARAADRQGTDAAYRVAHNYAEDGYVIISGLALGCDTAAHLASLAINGETIAIVATGLDLIHPKESISLQKEILAHGGLILSEQPIGVKANPTRLVARNRLQAALSQAVILAQCPEHSGSMHTMKFARKYHKQCMAVEFNRWYTENMGNKSLLDSGLASPIFLHNNEIYYAIEDAKRMTQENISKIYANKRPKS